MNIEVAVMLYRQACEQHAKAKRQRAFYFNYLLRHMDPDKLVDLTTAQRALPFTDAGGPGEIGE